MNCIMIQQMAKGIGNNNYNQMSIDDGNLVTFAYKQE